MKISVIIPIYKVEAYLHECVDSVLSQSYRDLEVILVDDGSPDGCPQICDEYARKDARVQVIHKENGGLSDARNVGLQRATGEYVLFIDSDDYWNDSDAVELLVDRVVQSGGDADVVLFGRTVFYEHRKDRYRWPSLDLDRINGKGKVEVLTYLTEIGNLYTSANNKLINRNLLQEGGIRFKKGLLCEDLDWSIQVYMEANKFYAVNNPFHCYRKRAGSITATMAEKNFQDLLFILSKWSERIPMSNISDEEKKIYLGFLCYQYCILIGLLSTADRDVKTRIRKEMKPYEWILRYDCNYKTHWVRRLYKALGFDRTGRLLSVYLKYNIKMRRILHIVYRTR